MIARLKTVLPYALLATLFAGVFIPLPPMERTRILDYAQDLGHFPACVIAFWALYQVRWFRLPKLRRPWCVALTVTVVQTAIEFLQPLVGRSASLRDWMLGFAGILFALTVSFFLRAKQRKTHAIWLGAMLALIVAVLAPLGLLIKDEARQRDAFPLLGSFEGRLEVDRWDLYGLMWVLSEEYVTHGEKSVRFEVTREFSYPGLFMEGTITDWSEYAALFCDVYWDEDAPRVVAIRVDDRVEQPGYADRGQVSWTLNPGYNTLVTPVDELMRTPGGRTMDRTHIARYGLFFEDKVVGDVFFVDGFRLQKSLER